jgi:hypothetical protein
MTDAQVPPYMSYGVFKATIDQLAESVVPTGAIDRRVLDGLSGADYGSLMSGLRFLGLTDEQRKATDRYRELVKASKDPDVFKTALLNVLSDKYTPIVSQVDIRHGTLAELEKAFKDAGVSPGQMLTKTIRFYIKALQDCGVLVSPHITKPRKPLATRTNGATRKRTPKTPDVTDRKTQDDQAVPDVAGNGFERLPIPGVAGAFIQYPTGLTEANCDLFDAMIGVLRTYVKGRAATKEKKA